MSHKVKFEAREQKSGHNFITEILCHRKDEKKMTNQENCLSEESMSSWKTLVKYTFYVTPFPLPCMQSNLPRSHLTPENPGEQQRALQAPWGGQDDTERGMRISGALTKASLSPILTPKSHGKFSNGKKTILRDVFFHCELKREE